MSPDNAALRALPAARIVRAVADAAKRWCNADFPPRVRATTAIEARLGYALPVVDFALDRLFGGLTRDALTAAIAGELGALAALDGFVAQPGRPASWARGAERVVLIASDTTIGVALTPLAFALCAKCGVVLKDRSDALGAAFVTTLAEEEPALGAACTVAAWTGGDDAREDPLLAQADVVVAFGGPDALRAIRSRAHPDARFVPFGHRASAGYVTRAALRGDPAPAAAAAVRDALLYDGDGCLSLHVLFVERGDDAALAAFADALATACVAALVEFPIGPREPGRAARARAYAERARFAAANGRGSVRSDPGGAWHVIFDAPRDEPPPFGAGALPLLLVDDLADAATYVRAHALPLQAVGVAGTEIVPQAFAEALGVVRIAPMGRLQDPPAAGRHGGQSRIADFVRWVDAE